MGLLTFAVPNYKTVLGRKISSPHCFRKSVMFKGDAILRP